MADVDPERIGKLGLALADRLATVESLAPSETADNDIVTVAILVVAIIISTSIAFAVIVAVTIIITMTRVITIIVLNVDTIRISTIAVAMTM